MRYICFVKQAKVTETKEVNLDETKIADFRSDTIVAIGDIIHLTEDDMVDGFEACPVKVMEIEHLPHTGITFLGVSANVSGQAQGEDTEGNPFIVTVPSIGELIDVEDYYEEAPDETRPKVVTILGSSRFHDEMIQVEKVLTLRGRVVMLHSPFTRNEHDLLSPDEFQVLSTTIEEKIRLSDEVVVVNPDGLIGESTGYAIEYAKGHGKKVTYYSDI